MELFYKQKNNFYLLLQNNIQSNAIEIFYSKYFLFVKSETKKIRKKLFCKFQINF